MSVDHVHFNGSVNLADAESVMRAVFSRVPSGVRRIPDGETGDRDNWISFQLQKFLQLDWLVRPGRSVRKTVNMTSCRSCGWLTGWIRPG